MGESPIRPYPYPSPPPALRQWNPRAPEVAARVGALIAERLPETEIEHVGSSSVPGCAGKGYLDFVIPFRDDSHLGAINDVLFGLGFGRQRNRDPFPETRPMRIGAIDHEGETYLLHVHVVPENTHEMAELIDFRDRLRADPPRNAPSSTLAFARVTTMPSGKANSSPRWGTEGRRMPDQSAAPPVSRRSGGRSSRRSGRRSRSR